MASSISSESLPPLGVEELDAVVVVEIVRGADDDAEAAFELAREIGDAGSGQRTDQHDVDAGGDETRLERRFEHVAGQARVLADQHRAAVRREHARRGARQSQREIHRHRMLADPTADAVGAEILTCHRNSSPCDYRGGHADRVDRRGHVVGAHDTRSVENRNGGQRDAARSSLIDSRPVSFASIDLRDSPTSSGTPSSGKLAEMFAAAPDCASMRLAETEAGIDDESRAARCLRRGTQRRARRGTR